MPPRCSGSLRSRPASFGSAIPFLLFTYAVARLPAARTGLPLNLIPVFGVLFAVALLKERLMTAQLLGGLLVVAGLGTAQLRVSDERTND